MIAAPFRGEFGWQLMKWQGFLRKAQPSIIYCERGYKYLYEDITRPVIEVEPIPNKKNKWRAIDHTPPERFGLIPCKTICEHAALKQRFIKYGIKGLEKGYDILIHARATQFAPRNWPEEKWNVLLHSLNGYKIGAIGRSRTALSFKACDDLRDIPLRKLANIMAESKVLIGPSSGPHHFAALCGLPSIIWTDQRKWNIGGIKTTNWNRYKKHWNPFNTPVTVMDTVNWQPSIAQVINALEKNGYL